VTSKETTYKTEACLEEPKVPSWQRLLSRPDFRVRERVPEISCKIADLVNINPIIAELLAARGHKADSELEKWLTAEAPDKPDLSKLKNCSQFINLMHDIEAHRTPVAVCCDFDVDGISSAAQFQVFLNSIGVRNCCLIPDRFTEGYGLSRRMVEQAAREGYKVLVTLDFGTTNLEELELARSFKIKTVVIDHHYVGEIENNADIFINPWNDERIFGGGRLCTSGLTYVILSSYEPLRKRQAAFPGDELLALATLGTICDVVPLEDLNRSMAKKGLLALTESKSPGLKALKEICDIEEVLSYDVAFRIGPAINAAGRMKTGDLAFGLLTAANAEMAYKIAAQLIDLNEERKSEVRRILEIAETEVLQKDELPEGIVVWAEGFNIGVVGIVAQRLVERFGKPAAVFGKTLDGAYGGSLRTVEGVSIINILNELRPLLIRGGGHAMAGGCALRPEDMEEFANAFNAKCKESFSTLICEPAFDADLEVGLDDISAELVQGLKALEPFGAANPVPRFLLRNLKIGDIKRLRDEHLFLTVSNGQLVCPAVLWRLRNHEHIQIGDVVDITCTPYINKQGKVQLSVEGVRKKT